MFKKSESNNDSSEYDNKLTSNNSPSILGPTLHIKGELSAEEDLVIEGQIEGSVRHNQQTLTVGQQGRVTGDIDANVITVEGSVKGNLNGEEAVIIKKTAKVDGDIRSRRIVIDEGAQFNGRIDMVNEQPQKLAINLGGSNNSKKSDDSSLDTGSESETSEVLMDLQNSAQAYTGKGKRK